MAWLLGMLGIGLNIWTQGSGLGTGTAGGSVDPLALLDRAGALILDRAGNQILTRV